MTSILCELGAGALTSFYDIGFSSLYFGLTTPLVYQISSRITAWAIHYFNKRYNQEIEGRTRSHQLGLITVSLITLTGSIVPSVGRALYALPLLIRRVTWPLFKNGLLFLSAHSSFKNLIRGFPFSIGYVISSSLLIGVGLVMPLMIIYRLKKRNQWFD